MISTKLLGQQSDEQLLKIVNEKQLKTLTKNSAIGLLSYALEHNNDLGTALLALLVAHGDVNRNEVPEKKAAYLISMLNIELEKIITKVESHRLDDYKFHYGWDPKDENDFVILTNKDLQEKNQ